jgi:hypothetical protein
MFMGISVLSSWTLRSRVQTQQSKPLQILNFLIIIKTSAQVINIFSKIQQNEKLFNLCQNLSCSVYTLFVSHVNDGFEMGIKFDIEFEWSRMLKEKERKQHFEINFRSDY